jgi:hypothetical protein
MTSSISLLYGTSSSSLSSPVLVHVQMAMVNDGECQKIDECRRVSSCGRPSSLKHRSLLVRR